MKLFYVALLSLFVIPFSLKAQTESPKNSIAAGYGVLTVQDIASTVSDVLIDPFTVGIIEVTDITGSGVVFVEYSHFWKSKWRFLVNANYTSIKSTFVNSSDQSNYGKGTDQYYALMVGVNYHWLTHNILELYSGLQAGGSYISTKQTYVTGDDATDNSFAFAFQVTPIGLRVGKTFGGFAELGFGYKGLINVGIDYRF
jgi:hypothetical protein